MIQGYPNRMIQGYPNRMIQGYPNRMIQGYPNRIIQGYPNRIIQGYPNRIIQGYPNRMIQGYPKRKRLMKYQKNPKNIAPAPTNHTFFDSPCTFMDFCIFCSSNKIFYQGWHMIFSRGEGNN